MQPDPDTDWFNRKLAEHRLSQAALGRMLGIDKSTMSLTLAGKRRLKIEHAADIARIFGVTTSEVLKRAGVRVDGIKSGEEAAMHLLPLEGWVDSNGHVHFEKRKKRQLMDIGCAVESGSFAVQWRTAQTRMDIFDGWLVVVGPRQEPNPDAMAGRACMVAIKDGDVVLRAVRRGYTPGNFTLLGIDLPDMIEAEIEWYAPVTLLRPTPN